MTFWVSFYLVLLSAVFATGQELVDDSSPAISYQPAGEWAHDDSAASLGCYNGTFTFSSLVTNRSDPTTSLAKATVTYIFDQPGTAFYWYGFQRSDGGLFSICIDCNGSDTTLVDAYNISSNGNDPPVLLYSTTNLVLAIHTVTIGNELDPRVGQYGQMTVDEFIVASAPLSSSSSSSSSTPSSATSASSATAAVSSQSLVPLPTESFPSAAASTTSHSTTATQSPSSTPSSAALASYVRPGAMVCVGAVAALLFL